MTGTERIKSRILDDARAKAAAIEEQAKREAKEILERAQAEAAQKKAEVLKKAEEDGKEAYRRLMSVAALESRKEILRAKQEMVETAFQKAISRVSQLPDKEYQKLLEDMIVASSTKSSGEILLSEKDRKRIGKDFTGNINKRLKAAGVDVSFTLSNEYISTAGGFILRSGEMEINGTFEILFGMLRPTLENEVVKILFGA